jgi:carbohydrate-binding DOMON domain-containing protein
MSTQYRLVQSGKTASGGCSAGQGSSEPVAPRIYLFIFILFYVDILWYGEVLSTKHQYLNG